MSDPSKEDYPFAAVHVGGCGATMFFLKRRPESGDIASSADLVMPDGEPVAYGSLINCPVCGALFMCPQTSWVELRN